MQSYLESGFKLGKVEVLPAENLLRLDGKTVHVEPKSMDVLLALAAAARETVSRDDLIRQVWPRGFVTDDALNRCISNLRSALGDNPKNPEYIATIPRKGYRLLTAVELHAKSSGTDSILVLPFQSLSAGEEPFVADGLTELLIARLSIALDAPVISRTTAMSFKGSNLDLQSISRQLGVQWVVEGSVMQMDEQVQIVVQLIDAGTDTHVWAESWTRPAVDLLTVLNEVSRLISGRVRSELQSSPRKLPIEQPLPVDLLREYLHGLHLNSQRTHESIFQAISCFENVLRSRPEHAPSLSGLSISNFLLAHYGAVPAADGFEEARKLALRAIELEPDLADAKMHLAAVSFHYDWAFERARSFLDEAMAINPGLEMALLLSANIHLVFQNHEKAQASIDRALEIDPLNIGLLMNAGDHLILQRRYREAIRVLESALKINSAFRPGGLRLSLALAFDNQPGQALACLEKCRLMGRHDAPYLEYLAIVEGASGNSNAARRAADKLQSLPAESGQVLPWSLARAWAMAGEPDLAIEQLNRAFDGRSSSMPFLGATPVFENLRQTERVQQLMKKIGIPWQ